MSSLPPSSAPGLPAAPAVALSDAAPMSLPPGSPTGRAFAGNRLFSLLRMGLRTAEAVVPRWAPAAAAQVFCTPVPTKLARRHVRPPTGVKTVSVPFENASLTLYHWPAGDDAPRVLLTHGWGGWGMQLAPLASALAAQGWAPVVIDQPAHGRSAAWSSTLPQFVRALGHVAHRLGGLDALIGHSMGGSAACVAAAQGLAVGRLALISAPTSFVQMTHDYARAFGLSDPTRARMVSRIESREGVVLAQLAAEHMAPRIQVPTLVVHDQGDTVVPHADAMLLSDRLPNARLFTTQGLGHRRLLGDAGVIAEVAGFLCQA
jgi:pimeloyl-ACP methyl ester carboxylesterase